MLYDTVRADTAQNVLRYLLIFTTLICVDLRVSITMYNLHSQTTACYAMLRNESLPYLLYMMDCISTL
jgi:hypothetical protein